MSIPMKFIIKCELLRGDYLNIRSFESKLLYILFTIGFILVVLTYYLLHTSLIFYDVLFWIGILLSGISTYYIISNNYKTETQLFCLFLFGFMLYLPHILSSPNYFHFYDELAHYQTALLIDEKGSIDVNVTSFTVSKYYPGIELLTIFFKNITGNSLFVSGRIIVGISHSFIALFMYLFFRNISSTKIAAIASLVYFFNSAFTFFDTYFSYESIGLPLLVLILFTVTKKNSHANSIGNTLIQVILLGAIVVTHHFSSYMVLLFLIILLTINIIFTYLKIKVYNRRFYFLTLLTGTFIFYWMVYLANANINYYTKLTMDSFQGILKQSIFGERLSEFTSIQLLNVPYFELFIRRYLYVPLILLLVLGGIYYLYNKKSLHNEFILTLIIYSSLFIISLVGLFTSIIEFSRFSPFGFIGIAFLIGICLENMQKTRFFKILSLISVIILIIGGISLGTENRDPYSTNIRIGQQSIESKVISSAAWSEKYLGRYNSMLSNSATSNVLEFYGIQKSISYGGWEVFFPTNVSFNATYYLESNGINYLAVDKRISIYISEVRYYFDRDELYIPNHPPFGRTEPLPLESITKFDKHVAFSNIYKNGNIAIYKINK